MGYDKIVEMLIKTGIDVNIIDNFEKKMKLNNNCSVFDLHL
jgi:hypothetical protein